MFSFIYSEKVNSKSVPEILKFIKAYPIIYKIFKLPALRFLSEDELNGFLRFADGIDNEFIRFTSVNFDDSKLELKFHTEYSDLLDAKDLQDKKEEIHTYYTSKGVMIDLNSLNRMNHLELLTPQTMAIVLMSPDTEINDEVLYKLDARLKSTITSLGINYLKNDEDYMSICSKVEKLVGWFDQIKNLKFNFLRAPPS